jgi:hypothetical protein
VDAVGITVVERRQAVVLDCEAVEEMLESTSIA